MEDFDEQRLTFRGIRETDLAGYLAMLGYEPVKVRRDGTDCWYQSPLRNEAEPSFGEGVIYGLTYVDHRKKAVFNGSELGKAYSAKAILERCSKGAQAEEKNKVDMAEKVGRGGVGPGGMDTAYPGQHRAGEGKNKEGPGILEALLEPGYQPEVMDWQLKRRKRKKKRRLLSLQSDKANDFHDINWVNQI